MAVTIVRLYHEAEELRAEVAMQQQQARILAEERDEAREAFAIATNNCVDAQKRLREMERERNEAILELGAIQATIAETLNLQRTPLTAADVHAALNHLTQ